MNGNNTNAGLATKGGDWGGGGGGGTAGWKRECGCWCVSTQYMHASLPHMNFVHVCVNMRSVLHIYVLCARGGGRGGCTASA